MKKINNIFYARRLIIGEKLSVVQKHKYIRFKYIQLGNYENN